MLTPEPSWLHPTDFLRAAEAGSQIALRNRQLALQQMEDAQSAADAAAGRATAEKVAQTNLQGKLAEEQGKSEALKRGQIESDRAFAQRLREFGLEEAKQTLEEKKLGMPKYFHDAKGGIYGIDPLTGELNILQQPQQAAGRVGTVSVPIPTGGDKEGRISISENDPRYLAWKSLQPTVTPGYTKPGFFRNTVVPPVTNPPPSLGNFLRTNTPASGTELPDIEGLNEPQAAPLRVLSIE